MRVNKSFILLHSKHYNKKPLSKLLFDKEIPIASRLRTKTEFYNRSKVRLSEKIGRDNTDSFRLSPWVLDDDHLDM